MGSVRLLPVDVVWDSYAKGWQGSGQSGFGLFFLNTFKLVLPTVLFTVLSSSFVAYGFARFTFPLKKVFFYTMISTMMLPGAVIIIPRYILFKYFGWINTYLPFIVPVAFACTPFFIFMLIQFFRGVPRELDESAIIDGCGSFRILTSIIVPLSTPALFSAGLFQFIWTWNDFFNALIYINSVRKYPISPGLRMALDVTSSVSWNQVLAMAVVSIVPSVMVFFFAQRYFVEGIATTGIKV